MEEIKLAIEKREAIGRGGARKLRRDGKLPAILYGPGEKAFPIAIDSKSFEHILHAHQGGKTVFTLTSAEARRGKKAIVKEIQRDAITGVPLHVDFYHVSMSKRVDVKVPLQLVGVPIGVREGGGTLQQTLREVVISVLPSDIPEHLEVDVSLLAVGDVMRVEDVSVPNAEVLTESDKVVASVLHPTVLKVEEKVEEEVLAEPELVGKEEPAEEET